jgi:hypothetical protein
MPTVRYTADGGRYRVAGTTFEPGDDADVPNGVADRLVDDVGSFERVHEHVTDVEYTDVEDSDADVESEAATGDDSDDTETDDSEAAEADEDADTDTGDEAASESEAADDVEEWADWNAEDWLDVTYQDRVDAVANGSVDNHLEAITEVETSQTVTDAVDERQSELEG